MQELPLEILHMIGLECVDCVSYGRLAYAVDLRLLSNKRLRRSAINRFTIKVTNVDGTQKWYVNGKLHREGDKPAVIYAHNSLRWYVNGKPHREGDKPAAIYPNGSQHWWVNGKFIRQQPA